MSVVKEFSLTRGPEFDTLGAEDFILPIFGPIAGAFVWSLYQSWRQSRHN